MSTPIKVSYGQTEDEYIDIISLSDEIRFKICMKLYKTHLTIEAVEAAIDDKSLKIIKDVI
jgi:hypothetical protein